jgi:SAM-dependent methyltransferase
MSASTAFQCLQCRKPLDVSFNQKNVACSCGTTYPVIEGIPILVDRPQEYIAEAYYLYYQHIISLDYQINVVNDNFASIPTRQSIRKSFVEALKHNRSNVQQLVDVLQPHTSMQQVLRVKTNPSNETSRYLKDFDYLRRDWSGHAEGEAQLEAITDALTGAATKFIHDHDEVLVLGAGTGRIAYDLGRLFKTVLATDLSFSMAYHFHAVMQGDFHFYEVNTQNVYHRDAFTRMIKAHRNGKDVPNLNAEVVKYFIADVKRLPLQDQSVACIVSVYFTDVLALKLWLKEIKRVLKAGGLFMHFGPLGYPFEDFREKLSAEEVADVFKENHFEILEDNLVPTGHLTSSQTLTNTGYKNWFMVARYAPIVQDQNLKLSKGSVLSLKGQVNFKLEGSLTHDTDRSSSNACTLFNDTGNKISGSEFILQVIKSVDAQKTVKEIIDDLSRLYDIGQEEEQHILQLLQRMIDEKLIYLLS